ncbi:MAG: hypothetical protein SFY81_13410 [Verrucomicrobiota bacterium]|nr:hypothetical protein [Verrucomicrobiota bacterium]
MPKRRLDTVREGMIVKVDVKNIDDMLLIPAGCTLSERHINLLQMWGVPEIQVEDTGEEESQDPLARLAPEALKKLEEDQRRIFWEHDEGNELHVVVFDLMLRRKARLIYG